MSNVDSQKIISVLKSEIENYDNEAKTEEVGRILSVGDGIATIYGLQHAKYGELLEFENGTEGMVLNLEQKTVGCVLFGTQNGLVEGSTVKCTGRGLASPWAIRWLAAWSMPWASPSTARAPSKPMITAL